MVAVLVMILVMAGLGASMLAGARGSRRKARKVSLNLQRNLVLDAAVVHGFHALRKQKVNLSSPLTGLKETSGEGKIGDIPYRFELLPIPDKKVVRIQVHAGEEPMVQDSYAVAYLRLENQGERTQVSWGLRYFEPEDQKVDRED